MDIPDALRTKAKEQEKTIPKTIRNSILKGGGIYIGCLGEICLVDALEDTLDIYQDNTYEYDVILEDQPKKLFLEVKTKTCAGIPLPEYECSVADANLTQHCDMYIFSRITKDFKTAFILGAMMKDKFMKISRQMRKGDEASNMKQGTIVQDCHNIYISELAPLYLEGMTLKPYIKAIDI